MSQEATVRTVNETIDWFKIGKEVHQGCILDPSYGSSAGKESACHAGDMGSNPGLGRSPGEGKGYPLQYSGLENSMDYIVHGIVKNKT